MEDWTATKRAQIIDGLEHWGVVKYACIEAGIPRSTYYLWRKEDPEFAAATAEAIDAKMDDFEKELFDYATEGEEDATRMRVLMWLMKCRRAGIYGDRPVDVNMRHSVDPELPAIMAKISGVTDDAGA